MDPSSTWPETLSLASGCPWIPGLPSCWHLGKRPPRAAAPFPLLLENPLAHTWKCTTHMLRILPVTDLRHPVYPVDGSQIPQSPIASCMTKHTCKWVSQPTPRPHSVPSSWLVSPGSSSSQLKNLCCLPGFPSHLPYSLSSLAWLMLVITN